MIKWNPIYINHNKIFNRLEFGDIIRRDVLRMIGLNVNGLLAYRQLQSLQNVKDSIMRAFLSKEKVLIRR